MYTDLVTGDVPGAATYFNPLLRQTIVPCTSGSRPSSPQTGSHAIETDTTRLIKWTGSTWEPQGSSRQSYTPTLTAASTNPTVGGGADRLGWYVNLPGNQLLYTFFIRFGTSPNAGSGSYFVSLPISSGLPFGSGVHSSVGSLQIADASAGTFRVGTCFVPGGTPTVLGLLYDNSGIVGSAAPWAWTTSDYISGSIIYPL